MKLQLALSTLLLCALLLPGAANAGDRQLELMFVNMTPDAKSGGESSACAKAIRQLAAKDYTRIRKQGETKTRKMVGVDKGGAHFTTWKAEQFSSIWDWNKQRDAFDTALLIDCRPDEGALDILVVPASKRKVVIRVRSKLSKDLINVVAARAMGAAWDGFSP